MWTIPQESKLPRRAVCWVLGVVSLAALFLPARSGADVIGQPKGNAADLHYSDLVAATRQADLVVVWEGLPRDDLVRGSKLPDSEEKSPLQIIAIVSPAEFARTWSPVRRPD